VAVRRESSLELELSGPQWCARFPGSASTATLALPWRRSVQAFILALEAGGAKVKIYATYRPPERAYLMHWAWRIYHSATSPSAVPAREGVAIRWVHPTQAESWEAARAMVQTYALVHETALMSRHTERLAVDLSVSWSGGIHVRDGDGQLRRLSSARGFDNNPDLHEVGRSYGVVKLVSDKTHWSVDGH
jgi:hypothetical protein